MATGYWIKTMITNVLGSLIIPLFLRQDDKPGKEEESELINQDSF